MDVITPSLTLPPLFLFFRTSLLPIFPSLSPSSLPSSSLPFSLPTSLPPSLSSSLPPGSPSPFVDPYVVRDRPQYIDVYKQKTFIYTGQEDCLSWKEYGITLYFPSTPSLQSNVTPSQESKVPIEVTVSVRSTEDDNYIFPVRSDLVSAVYGITADKKFPVPVTVQVEHCIPLHDDDEAARLGMSFMTASLGPPYVFHDRDGGSFRSGSLYGEITLSSFSDIAIRIKWWVGFTLPFFASVFYTNPDKALFVVTQNLAAHIAVSSV